MNLVRVLQHRPFALLWSGQSISQLGDAVYHIALMWWILQTTHSAVAMGGILVCQFAPMLVFLLVGGMAVDRYPRLWLMLASDGLRGVIVGLVALLAAQHHLTIWHIYAASLVFGFVGAFFRPAYTAVLPDLVPAERLAGANALTGLSQQTIGLAGPGLGALLVAWAGLASAFLFDSATFLISTVFLFPLAREPALRRSSSRGEGMIRNIGAGFRVVAGSRWLWMTITLASLVNITESGPRNVVFPFLMRDTLHAGVGAFGLLYSMFSVGAILASLWLGRKDHLRHRGLLIYGGWLLSAVCMAGLIVPITLAGAALCIVIWGASFEIVGQAWTNTLQDLVPGKLLGRVASIDYLGSFSLLPIGYSAAGILADRVGSTAVFGLGALATAALAGIGLMQPAIRAIN